MIDKGYILTSVLMNKGVSVGYRFNALHSDFYFDITPLQMMELTTGLFKHPDILISQGAITKENGHYEVDYDALEKLEADYNSVLRCYLTKNDTEALKKGILLSGITDFENDNYKWNDVRVFKIGGVTFDEFMSKCRAIAKSINLKDISDFFQLFDVRATYLENEITFSFLFDRKAFLDSAQASDDDEVIELVEDSEEDGDTDSLFSSLLLGIVSQACTKNIKNKDGTEIVLDSSVITVCDGAKQMYAINVALPKLDDYRG